MTQTTTATPTDELRSMTFDLESVIDKAFDEETEKKLKGKLSDAMFDAVDGLMYHAKNDFAYNLSRWVQRMTEDAIKAMLNGDDATMRRHLQCEEGHYTGRDRDHLVIRGKLFETGAIELRKSIADAHPDLLKNERILDLEAQVSSLVSQIRRLEDRNDELIRNRIA